ncbi:VOC family protein [Salinibacterium hongtaonis]|uniref:VOC family protein n=1 Tax=Homoserinimonas hongtaonis TaxID=2079791 RepID=UPI003BB0CC03
MGEAVLAGGGTQDDLDARSIAEDPTGVGQRLYFQRVPEAKTVKNRVHLDINATPGRRPTPEELDAERDRIVALGASQVAFHEEAWGPFVERHYVMRDPEGNEFCIQ